MAGDDQQDRREADVEDEAHGEDAPPIAVAPEDLAPETLRAVIESFVLREGTDYGLHERSLDDKVAQVLAQLQRREASIVYDPATASVSIVTAAQLRAAADASRTR